MGRHINRGPIPSELGPLIDTLADHARRLATLEAPDAATLANTVSRVDVVYDWTTLTAVAPWVAGVDAATPQVRRDGNLVTYRGSFTGGTAGTTAADLPTWAYPERLTEVPIRLAGAGTGFTTLALWPGPSAYLQPGGNLNAAAQTFWIAAA